MRQGSNEHIARLRKAAQAKFLAAALFLLAGVFSFPIQYYEPDRSAPLHPLALLITSLGVLAYAIMLQNKED